MNPLLNGKKPEISQSWFITIKKESQKLNLFPTLEGFYKKAIEKSAFSAH